MHQMRPKGKLTTFDWVGVACAAFLGACLGGIMATASDIRPSLILGLLFPGALIGLGVAIVFRFWAGVVASALLNGIAYSALLYGWDRLINELAERIPNWMSSLGEALNNRSERRKHADADRQHRL